MQPSPCSMGNLFAPAGQPYDAAREFFQTLLEAHGVRVERIVSQGQATPPGEWYDQDWDEWVLLLSGAARLCLEGVIGDAAADSNRCIVLSPGDYVWLPAHCRHRVEWTDPQQQTLWLALHFPPVI